MPGRYVPKVWFEFMDYPNEKPIILPINEVPRIPEAGDDVGLQRGMMPPSSNSFRLDTVIRTRHYWTPEGVQEMHVLLGRNAALADFRHPYPIVEAGAEYVVLQSPVEKRVFGISFDRVDGKEQCNVTELREGNARTIPT